MVVAAPTLGHDFDDFCASYIRQTKGPWADAKLVLEPWQRDFWHEALEVGDDGKRVYRELLLGLPRKNGKSTMAAAAALYFLTVDDPGEPEVIIAAGAKMQAGIVLGQSRSMALRSPYLLDHVKVSEYKVTCPENGGVLRSVASDAALQHGLNPSASIIDELHAHESGELYTALSTATGARSQPFTLSISTAGVAGHGILADLYASMFNGPGQLDDRGALRIYRDRPNGTLIWWYGAPDGADIESPDVWRACNPASWFQDAVELGREYARLKARGAILEWRRYHLNQFVGIESSWLPDGAWEACADGFAIADGVTVFEHPLNPELPVGVGIDKGQTSDLSAVVIAQRQGDKVVVRSKVFPPEAATGRVSSEAMRQELRRIRATYPLPMVRDEKNRRPIPGPAFAFDRWSFSESAETLEQDGLNMVDFPQWASTLGPASTMAYELITTGRVVHDGDPILAEHVRNTTAVLTERGMKVAKPKKMTPFKNDACVAMVMAIAMAMQDAPKPLERAPRTVVGLN